MIAPAQARTPSASTIAVECTALAGRTVGALVVEHAERVAAGPLATGRIGPNGAAAPSIDAPAHCLVGGVIEPRVGADGKPYAITVQLRIPERWNGRLFYQGAGGLHDMVNVAYGANLSQRSSAPPAVARGFAVVSTDSGHQNANGGLARVRVAADYGCRPS
jgi:feruloyl esterase